MAEATAFRNNALPYPVYGLPYVVVFPLLDADGDPVTGATCDSEVSLNGDTGVDCTNEGTEITYTTATNKGMYYLVLTAAEMTADIVSITIYSATSKATPIVLYPRKLPQIHAGTGTAGAASTITLQNTARALDDYYNGALIYIHTGTGSGQARVISDYTSSYVATVSPAWATTPDNTSQYYVYLTDMAVNAMLANVMGWIGAPCATPTVAGVPEVDVTHMVGGTQTVTDLKDFADAGYDPATNKVQGVVLTDTCTTNSDMRGTDNAALASVLGALADSAAVGDPTSADTVMQYVKQLINILAGSDGIGIFPAEAAPANAVSLAEVIRAIHADVTGLNGNAMRGTNDAALATALATAQSDLDVLTGSDGATLATAQANYAPAKAGDAMTLENDAITSAKYDETTAFPIKSTDSGATQIARVGADGDTLETLSDQIDAVPTVSEIQTEMEENGASILDTLQDRITTARAGYLDELDPSTSAKMAWYMAKMFIALVNKGVYTEADGTTEQFDGSDVSLGTISSAFTSDGTYTTRKRLVI